MTAVIGLAIPVGLGLGLGLWTLVGIIPRIGRAGLGERVGRYLVDVSPQARADRKRPPSEPSSLVLALAGPWARRIDTGIVRVFGGDAVVARRLHRAGWSIGVDVFRGRQLLCGAGGLAVGIGAAALVSRAVAGSSPVAWAALIAFATALGLVLPDQLLTRAVRSRQRRIAAELPTIVEFLALALSAGEGVVDALRRVSRTGTGELAREFGRVVADVNTGTPLPEALARCAGTVDLPALTRTVDQLIGALDRGTPLVGVFRAQALESREDAKRQLIEAAGRKEVAMLVPLVFLILPVTVAFAVFPGLLVLQLAG